MINIKLDKLNVGMVLAQNVKDRNGRVILASGQEIAEKHLKILKSWGITDVVIESFVDKNEAIVSLGNFDAVTVTKVEDEMKSLFRQADLRHPMARELFNLCIARKLKAQERGGS